MAQTWRDLLFMHWPVTPEALRPFVPAPLTLDTYEGQAWIGIVPFLMTDIRLRRLPPIPGTTSFPELNVRTYATLDAKPGVCFLSLDAANVVAVEVARRWFHLPYVGARISRRRVGDEITYVSRRHDSRLPRPARLEVRYRSTGAAERARPGSLAHWLTERYCLYVAGPAGGILRGEIHHAPWSLEPGAAEIAVNTMAAAAGVALPDRPPELHFARELAVRLWSIEPV